MDPSIVSSILANQSAQIAELQAQVHDLIQSQSALNFYDGAAIDAGWTLMAGFLVFLMQLGFLLFEAGSVKAINTKNVMYQNCLDTCISVICWYLFGFGLSQGYYSVGVGDMSEAAPNNSSVYVKFFFLWSFNNAATTIVSGAITSRVKFAAYISSCILISGFVYPMVCYWVWGNGMFGLGLIHADGTRIQQYPVLDFAGGSVVHQVGGTAGLVMAWIVGPRTGRFVQNSDGKWEDKKEPGHSVVLATIGAFLLWFGWVT
jgi:Amt family ammonium transporter